jgi:hypothetical protein
MDRRQRRHLARRPVARRPGGFHPFVLAAWLLAALLCGVVLWLDSHFLIQAEGDAFGVQFTMSMSFGCRAMVVKVNADSQDPVDEGLDERLNETRERTYAEGLAEIRDDTPLADRGREVLTRLLRAGTALLALAYAAPLLGLLGIVWAGASPTLRHVLLLLAALLPLAAMEYFGLSVDALFAETRSSRPAIMNGVDFGVGASGATWWARIAWGGLAGAAAISWWRWPKPHRATPVDPGVFE